MLATLLAVLLSTGLIQTAPAAETEAEKIIRLEAEVKMLRTGIERLRAELAELRPRMQQGERVRAAKVAYSTLINLNDDADCEAKTKIVNDWIQSLHPELDREEFTTRVDHAFVRLALRRVQKDNVEAVAFPTWAIFVTSQPLTPDGMRLQITITHELRN